MTTANVYTIQEIVDVLTFSGFNIESDTLSAVLFEGRPDDGRHSCTAVSQQILEGLFIGIGHGLVNKYNRRAHTAAEVLSAINMLIQTRALPPVFYVENWRPTDSVSDESTSLNHNAVQEMMSIITNEHAQKRKGEWI